MLGQDSVRGTLLAFIFQMAMDNRVTDLDKVFISNTYSGNGRFITTKGNKAVKKTIFFRLSIKCVCISIANIIVAPLKSLAHSFHTLQESL